MMQVDEQNLKDAIIKAADAYVDALTLGLGKDKEGRNLHELISTVNDYRWWKYMNHMPKERLQKDMGIRYYA